MLLAAHAVAALGSAGWLGRAAHGAGFALAWPGACASLICGLVFGCLFVLSLGVRGKLGRIDISAVGQIRLTVYQAMGGTADVDRPCVVPVPGQAEQGGNAVLMPGSTLWPHFMLLRLRKDDGQVVSWPVWQHSVEPGAFRALSVACRSIAIRTNMDQ